MFKKMTAIPILPKIQKKITFLEASSDNPHNSFHSEFETSVNLPEPLLKAHTDTWKSQSIQKFSARYTLNDFNTIFHEHHYISAPTKTNYREIIQC